MLNQYLRAAPPQVEDTLYHLLPNNKERQTFGVERRIICIVPPRSWCAEPSDWVLLEVLVSWTILDARYDYQAFQSSSISVQTVSKSPKQQSFLTKDPLLVSLPGFVEISLLDQVHLLECCWLEVLMMGLMWRSVDHPGKLIFSPDLSLSRYRHHTHRSRCSTY